MYWFVVIQPLVLVGCISKMGMVELNLTHLQIDVVDVGIMAGHCMHVHLRLLDLLLVASVLMTTVNCVMTHHRALIPEFKM